MGKCYEKLREVEEDKMLFQTRLDVRSKNLLLTRTTKSTIECSVVRSLGYDTD